MDRGFVTTMNCTSSINIQMLLRRSGHVERIAPNLDRKHRRAKQLDLMIDDVKKLGMWLKAGRDESTMLSKQN